MSTIQEFPVCGPRKPVEDALRSRQFVMSGWSDKWWKRLDGLEAHVYGAGSRLSLMRGRGEGSLITDGPVAETLAFIDGMTS